jgi:hypothetical protein
MPQREKTYALAEYTVEARPKGWFFCRTCGDKSDIKRPYSSPSSVSLMIARALKKELRATELQDLVVPREQQADEHDQHR